MADDTVTDDPAKASQDEVRRRIMEELQRRQQQQPQQQQQFSGFALSAEAREKQRKRREQEAAARQQQQREYNDIFLKTVATIYGLPPKAESFKQEFVPILMACTVLQSSPDMVVGKFAGAQELPPVQVAKDHVIAQGGNMTPELAMQMAMLAASNPDMQREGVEIKGATEEDKLMLYAAAQILGLKVINPPTIDNEQNQAQRIEACKLGWQNLHKWAAAGPAQPAPGTGPAPGPDDEEEIEQPQPGSQQRPPQQQRAANVPPVVPVPTPASRSNGGNPPPSGGAPAANVSSDYEQLSDEHKEALRSLFRALSQGSQLTDAEIDKQLAPVWAKQNDEQRAAILKQAQGLQEALKAQAEQETAPPELTLTPPDAPIIPGAPTLPPVGQRKFKELLPAERHLLQEHGKQNGIKKDDVAKNWNRMREPGREKRYAEAAALDETTAARAEEQRQAELRKLNKRYEADVEKIKQDHEAELKLFKAGLLAADPATLTDDTPVIRPVEARKFAELLPLEQELLRTHAVQKGENPATVSRRWNRLSEDGRINRFEEASNGNKELAFDAAQQKKDAAKILADAIVRAKANAPAPASRQPAPQKPEEDAAPPAPKRAWAELSEADREEIREFVRREQSLEKAGDDYTEEEIAAPWSRIPNGEQQNDVLNAIKQRNIAARGPSLASITPPSSLQDRVKQKSEIDAAAAAAAVNPDENAAADLDKDPAAEPLAAGSPLVSPAADEKPHRSFRQIVTELLSTVWKAISAPFRRTPKPGITAEQLEPLFTDEVAEAPPAPGADEAAKKKFNDLLLQEKRLLLVEHSTSGTEGELATQWDGLDEAARAKLFNTAFQNNPLLHADLKAEQDKAKNQPPAPAQDLEPAPVEATPIVEVKAATPPVLLKDAIQRNWSELLDSEKEALQDVLDHNEDGSEWNNMNEADRATALQLGTDDKPELAAKIEDARKAENDRLVSLATPASLADRVNQAAAVVATTPPPSLVERANQAAGIANGQTVAPPQAEQEVPQDDAAFEGALKAKGLTRDALLAMPVEQRNGILAEIKAEKDKGEVQQPVVEARRDEPAVAPVIKPVSFTAAFNTISVDNIHELPPSNDARRVIQNASLPKRIDKENLLQAYQQIRAEVVRHGASSPGFRVTQAFLGEAARKHHTETLLGHRGLDSQEANVILDCLREEGLTTGKKNPHRNVSHAANDWQAKLATHYTPEM